MNTRTVALTLVACIACAGALLGVRQVLTSPDTAMPVAVVGSTGGSSSSTNYRLDWTAGQPAPLGQSQSTNYRLRSGFWEGVWGLADNDADGFRNALDNCPSVANPAQTNTDGDSMGDACDPNDDNDIFPDTVEAACGSDSLDAARRPERVDGPFAGVSDDGDADIDEALPGGTANFDCDGDGYKGSAEDHVFSYLTQTDGDQKTCQEYDTTFPNSAPHIKPSKRWPSDLAGVTAFSLNKINIQDLSSFTNPIRYLNQDVGTDPMDVRFDLVPGSTIGADINIADLAALTSSSPTGYPPMLGGAKAFGGPVCPYAP